MSSGLGRRRRIRQVQGALDAAGGKGGGNGGEAYNSGDFAQHGELPLCFNSKKRIMTETEFIEYIKEKEIVFIKNDMKNLNKGKTDYSKLLKYYKRKLVDYGVMKELRNSYKSEGKYIKVKEVV